eukprot:jgi/Bigna1/66910/fgenesh1_pg.2_\
MASPISPAIFESEQVDKVVPNQGWGGAGTSYRHAQPYPHIHIHNFCKADDIERVRNECLALNQTFRETDLFKIYQSIDLGNVHPASDQARQLEHLMRLRTHLYSRKFRAYLQKVTGCGELTDRVDCAFNVYSKGCHLLCHDDAISTRKLSYIIYLSDRQSHDADPSATTVSSSSSPSKGGDTSGTWSPEFGGGLELFAVDMKKDLHKKKRENVQSKLEASSSSSPSQILPSSTFKFPGPYPEKVLMPEYNSIVVFQVVPGSTYHAVQEVFSKDHRRLSIQGWFHAPQKAEGWNTQASLRLLQLPSLGLPSDLGLMELDLSEYQQPKSVRSDLALLRHYISRLCSCRGRLAYEFSETGDVLLGCLKETLETTNPTFTECVLVAKQSSLEAVLEFLNEDLIEGLSKLLLVCDEKDMLGRSSSSCKLPPDYRSGITEEWKQIGPAFKQRYLRYEASSGISKGGKGERGSQGGKSEVKGHDHSDGRDADPRQQLGAALDDIRTTLFHSRAFARLLEWLTGVPAPVKFRGEVRRSDPLDQLDNDGTEDFSFGDLLITVARVANFLKVAGGARYELQPMLTLMITQAYVAEGEGGREAPQSASAANNCLRIQLRRPNRIKFVRYVSHAAPSSRFDIAAEYKLDVVVVEEDEMGKNSSENQQQVKTDADAEAKDRGNEEKGGKEGHR